MQPKPQKQQSISGALGLNKRILQIAIQIHPSKHETLPHCWFDVGPPSAILVQHQTNNGATSRVCWDVSSLQTGIGQRVNNENENDDRI